MPTNFILHDDELNELIDALDVWSPAMSADLVFQEFYDYVRAGDLAMLTVAVGTLMSWHVDLENPYSPIEPRLRAFAKAHNWSGVLDVLAVVRREHEAAHRRMS